MARGLFGKLGKLGIRLGFDQDWYLILIAAVIGFIMGGAALAFIKPIQWLEAIGGETAERGLGTLVLYVCLAPVIGALLTGIIILLTRLPDRGHGISTVIYSVNREQSKLPFRLLIRHWLASTATIGSGGSAGPEGPIVSIGATVGSCIGRVLKSDPEKTATLLGCGAAAGLASVFNAPMAGIFFVLEVILRDFSFRTFTPIVVAAVISAATTQTILGTNQPLFGVGPDFFMGQTGEFNVAHAPVFVVLGAVCGASAVLFIRALLFTEKRFHKLGVPRIIRPAIGAAILAIMGVAYVLLSPHLMPESISSNSSKDVLPSFYGNGYLFIEQLLDPKFYMMTHEHESSFMFYALLGVLLLWGVLKVLGTCLTLGSGGSGGLFAPSLVLGAIVGGFVGVVIDSFGWFPGITPAPFALVGMAAMVAATAHAPLTGIFLVYELTRNYNIILPLMLAAVISVVVGRIIFRQSIYTAELAALGVRLGVMSDLTILRRMTTRDIPMVPPVLIKEADTGKRLLKLSEKFNVNDFVVVNDDEEYLGMVTGNDLRAALVYREAIPLLQVSELERSNIPTVTQDETLDQVLNKFSNNDLQSLPVIGPKGEIIGMITRSRLMKEYQNQLEKDST